MQRRRVETGTCNEAAVNERELSLVPDPIQDPALMGPRKRSLILQGVLRVPSQLPVRLQTSEEREGDEEEKG